MQCKICPTHKHVTNFSQCMLLNINYMYLLVYSAWVFDSVSGYALFRNSIVKVKVTIRIIYLSLDWANWVWVW